MLAVIGHQLAILGADHCAGPVLLRLHPDLPEALALPKPIHELQPPVPP